MQPSPLRRRPPQYPLHLRISLSGTRIVSGSLFNRPANLDLDRDRLHCWLTHKDLGRSESVVTGGATSHRSACHSYRNTNQNTNEVVNSIEAGPHIILQSSTRAVHE